MHSVLCTFAARKLRALRTMITIDKIDDLDQRLDALKGYLDIEDKRGRILEEEKYTLDPDFWNDQKKAQVVMHKIRELKRWVGLYESVKREVDDLGVIFEFFKAKEVPARRSWRPSSRKPRTHWRSLSSRTCSAPRRTH